jgi:hypothetical protein
MHENLVAVLRSKETEPLLGVEPLDCARWHFALLIYVLVKVISVVPAVDGDGRWQSDGLDQRDMGGRAKVSP